MNQFNAIKSTLDNLDLYGNDILLQQIKNTYFWASHCKKSIPTLGSPTIPMRSAFEFNFKVLSYKFRRNDDLILYTDKAVILFWSKYKPELN